MSQKVMKDCKVSFIHTYFQRDLSFFAYFGAIELDLSECAVNCSMLPWWWQTSLRQTLSNIRKKWPLLILLQALMHTGRNCFNLFQIVFSAKNLQYGSGNYSRVQKSIENFVFRPKIRDIHIECSKQFKWNLYKYVSGQSGSFLAVLKLL